MYPRCMFAKLLFTNLYTAVVETRFSKIVNDIATTTHCNIGKGDPKRRQTCTRSIYMYLNGYFGFHFRRMDS